MQLSELGGLLQKPQPFDDYDNIPWNEPSFSRRMLREHLSQDRNLASRQVAIIEHQVDWIHQWSQLPKLSEAKVDPTT